ncbi:hypothetical protein EXIGLDRAFT_725294 [Exidia glandulosa HHB12029]|uniref:Uncharacterized protein n=1 Tax=Exidia glandulosa HHB12029 TaxID=1314781 RepID=A0A165MJ88_EXIGL|nr:hypothetical protein EXIGLDRAFT_725294 [Exidia glandulosa HHB12029]
MSRRRPLPGLAGRLFAITACASVASLVPPVVFAVQAARKMATLEDRAAAGRVIRAIVDLEQERIRQSMAQDPQLPPIEVDGAPINLPPRWPKQEQQQSDNGASRWDAVRQPTSSSGKEENGQDKARREWEEMLAKERGISKGK